VADGDGGFAVSHPSSEPPVLGGEVGLATLAGCGGALGKDLAEPSAAPLADAGDGVEPITGLTERGDHPVDLDVEGGDRPLQVLDVVEDDTQHDGMVSVEPAPQRLAQQRNLAAQLSPGQFGKRVGITLTADQGAQHRPPRHTLDTAPA
jgi:hypothetical protein